MSGYSLNRIVTLCNGTSAPLGRVVACLGLLDSYLENPDLEWDAVYYLREVALGRSIEPEQAAVLIRAELLAGDGNMDEIMKAVILSAVRGRERVLYLSSPFTDSIDEALASYLAAKDKIISSLNPDEAREFFASDPIGTGEEIRKAIEEAEIPERLDRRIDEAVQRIREKYLGKRHGDESGPGEERQR